MTKKKEIKFNERIDKEIYDAFMKKHLLLPRDNNFDSKTHFSKKNYEQKEKDLISIFLSSIYNLDSFNLKCYKIELIEETKEYEIIAKGVITSDHDYSIFFK